MAMAMNEPIPSMCIADGDHDFQCSSIVSHVEMIVIRILAQFDIGVARDPVKDSTRFRL